MGMFDFLKGKKEHKFAQKEKETVFAPVRPKKDLGVCIPNHAKSAEEKKKLPKKEVSPFDKLREEHAKEMGRTLLDIESQESEEPYEYEPEFGIGGIEYAKKENQKVEPEENNNLDENDELDRASKKMSEGYVPKFSSTARKKLGFEDENSQQDAVPRAHGSFEVSGVYVGAETMISGTVVSGKITKRMSTQLGKTTVRVSDLKKSFVSVDELRNGESGTIFSRGSTPSMLRNGDVLEFS
ncbi:Uncharacterised protein [uncultured archaeon]|nr:Uncharacterised protein [uncultured archaeon]